MYRLIPERSGAPELLDGPITDPAMLRANLLDMSRANRWMGGERALMRRVQAWLRVLPSGDTPRVLDVATGHGAVPVALHRWSVKHRQRMTLLASDLHPDVLRVAAVDVYHLPIRLLRHDALHLPFADRSIDIVMCSQALHHFSPDQAILLLRELSRVARLGVIVSDLRRSYLAYWGARLIAIGMSSPLSRHDGPLSVLRAYTPGEVLDIVEQAQVPATVRAARGFRLEVEVNAAHAGA